MQVRDTQSLQLLDFWDHIVTKLEKQHKSYEAKGRIGVIIVILISSFIGSYYGNIVGSMLGAWIGFGLVKIVYNKINYETLYTKIQRLTESEILEVASLTHGQYSTEAIQIDHLREIVLQIEARHAD